MIDVAKLPDARAGIPVSAAVIPYPGPGARRARPTEAAEPRGQILLFTGVRYERVGERAAARPAAAKPRRRREPAA